MQKRTQKRAPKSRARPLGPTWASYRISWGRLRRHGRYLGPTAGAMLHISGPTWSDAGPLATSWVPTWTPCWIFRGKLEGHVAKVPRLPAKTRSPVARVPRLPHKKENKNEQQRAVLGSWGQLGRHIGPLGADLGAMLGILGSTWDHVAPLGPDFGPDLGPCWTWWARLERHARLLGADSKAMKILGSACSRNYIIYTHLAPSAGLSRLTWG